MTLTRVEAGVRALKSVLGLRPIFHQREDRCEGHIFITVLAYHLLHWVEYMLQSSGDRRSWPTIRRLLQTHSYTTIVYPAPRATRSIRAPGVPDEAQQQIYATLGINWRSCAKTVTVA